MTGERPLTLVLLEMTLLVLFGPLVTGTIQKLKEVTVTPEYKVSSHLILRGDLRVDWSDADVFSKKDGAFKGNQATVLLNAIYVF